ncbi:dihydropteroate synthase [Sandarakinorhabdus sp.]|uniref:dihydropteroate synthase n=1 Tax=Sandarakinorhabdus sp. TaxID=1916663 RepID=UPI00286DCC6C|nr:dihydropteroate synthase [Sandarakinorhabdus sp.]
MGLPLAGGPLCFAEVDVLDRASGVRRISAGELPDDVRHALTAPRRLPAGLPQGRPAVMGILNLTPDSFSDGGRLGDDAAMAAAVAKMATDGADIIDLGAESTRPGAAAVDLTQERARLVPVLPLMGSRRWSIDTRKAAIMGDALAAGAAIVNDVSALTFDAGAAAMLAGQDCHIVLMHHQGTPETMQVAPRYDDALLDCYDWLEGRIAAVVAAGIARDRLIIDPGIGFGKALAHNVAILRGLPLLHGLGLPILLGASRKALISGLAGPAAPGDRLGGSLALALHGADCGVQILRVHDVPETRQALALWSALRAGG